MSPDLTQDPGIGRSKKGPDHAHLKKKKKTSLSDYDAVSLRSGSTFLQSIIPKLYKFLILFSFVQAFHEYKERPAKMGHMKNLAYSIWFQTRQTPSLLYSGIVRQIWSLLIFFCCIFQKNMIM